MRRHRRPRRRKSDKLQCAGFFVILGAAFLADLLLALEPMLFGATVLSAMVLAGGYLIWLSNQ